MNRYIVTDDGTIVDRWRAEAADDPSVVRFAEIPEAGDPIVLAETWSQNWNRDEIHRAARRRGVKP